MGFASTRSRLTLAVGSAAYAGVLLVTVVETPPTTEILVGAVLVFALSSAGPVRLADDHGLRSPAVAFFGTVALLLAAAWWHSAAGVDAFVAMSIHLFGLFVVAGVGAGELFLQGLTGARGA
jgi:hypothetical protein